MIASKTPSLKQQLSVEVESQAIEDSLESYMSKPIRCRRVLNAPKGIDAISARRSVRRNTALGFRYEDCKGDSKKGDPLNFKINGFLRALQQELLATEGRPSAAVQQEARDADNASKPKEDSPEIRAYFERIWGPLKNRALHS